MKENKKKIIYLALLITVTITAVGVATYAYFSSSVNANANVLFNVATANGSVFTASSEGDISFDLSFDQMTEAGVSTNVVATDNATITVKLDSESEREATLCTYDIVWVWDSEDKYIESDVELPYIKDNVTYPYEFTTKVDSNEEKDLSTLTWKEVDTKTEAIIGTKQIIIVGKGSKTNIHQVDVSAYNIPIDQQNLFNKEFRAHIEVKNNKCMTSTPSINVTPSYKGVEEVPLAAGALVNLECAGANAVYNQKYNQLEISSLTADKTNCTLTYTDRINTPLLTDKVKSITNGQVVHEIATINNLTFIPGEILTSSDYTGSIVNDATTPWVWSDTDNSWTSANKGDDYKRTTTAIEYTPKENGHYQICYKQSSENSFDYGRIYLDEIEVKSLQEIESSEYTCKYLGNLTTSSKVKVTYQKNSSGNKGLDEVSFYLQKTTAVENIRESDAGYRYEGKEVDNYVWFNNELWRIIGVFGEDRHGQLGEELTKIIRANSIGGLAWDKSSKNNWADASLNKLLNGAYLNKKDGTNGEYCCGYGPDVKPDCDYTKKGIALDYQNMIKEVTWYLGASDTKEKTTEEMYAIEMAPDEASINAKIGLMYVSDYGYAAPSANCARTTQLYPYNSCTKYNWLYGQGYEWTIMSNSYGNYNTFSISYDGGVSKIEKFVSHVVRPVLYLNSSVYVVGGTGTQADPYIVGMN